MAAGGKGRKLFFFFFIIFEILVKIAGQRGWRERELGWDGRGWDGMEMGRQRSDFEWMGKGREKMWKVGMVGTVVGIASKGWEDNGEI